MLKLTCRDGLTDSGRFFTSWENRLFFRTIFLNPSVRFSQTICETIGTSGSFINVLGNILQAVLTTGMGVTAIIGIVLDNTLPGATRAERGLEVWEKEASEEAWEKAEAEWAAMEEGEVRPV
jgi:uncharacterized membrane protein